MYRLVPLDTLAPDPAVLERLVALCNEPELFRWLFAARCIGRPYGPEDARGWLAWGVAGWRAGGPCAFVALDEDGLPAAFGRHRGSHLPCWLPTMSGGQQKPWPLSLPRRKQR